jgi:hypothetical protein
MDCVVSQLKMIADKILSRSRIVFFGVILNRIPPVILNVCSLSVRKAMCMPFARRGKRALERLLRISCVCLARFVTGKRAPLALR